jgi:fatty acid desaturase
MRLQLLDLAGHAARIAASAVLLAVAPPVLTPVAAVALFLACFAIAHDLTHGALGLPRRPLELALTLIGLGLVTSGHAMRRMHLLHHARPMQDGDLEGAAATMSLAAAALAAPRLAVQLRVEAYRRAGARERRLQLVEHALCAAIVVAALVAPPALSVYVAITLLAQATSPVWAGHLPHRMPPRLLRVLAAFAFTRSPTVLSLAFHDLHHDCPKVPCQQLGRAARAAS